MSLKAHLGQLLVLLGLVCLALTAHAEPKPAFYIGYNPALAKRQVVHGQSYDITWGGTYVSYVDVHLEAQTARNETIPRQSSVFLARNLTTSPFTWNVTQPLGTMWLLDFRPMGMNGTYPGVSGIEVVRVETSDAVKAVSASYILLLSALSASAFCQLLSA